MSAFKTSIHLPYSMTPASHFLNVLGTVFTPNQKSLIRLGLQIFIKEIIWFYIHENASALQDNIYIRRDQQEIQVSIGIFLKERGLFNYFHGICCTTVLKIIYSPKNNIKYSRCPTLNDGQNLSFEFLNYILYEDVYNIIYIEIWKILHEY